MDFVRFVIFYHFFPQMERGGVGTASGKRQEKHRLFHHPQGGKTGARTHKRILFFYSKVTATFPQFPDAMRA